jgi:putative addiction module CopG family antidote
MPTRSVNLTPELDRFVATKIKSGRYEDASEVVRAGLRKLEREEQEHAAKLAALRSSIDEASRIALTSRGEVSIFAPRRGRPAEHRRLLDRLDMATATMARGLVR